MNFCPQEMLSNVLSSSKTNKGKHYYRIVSGELGIIRSTHSCKDLLTKKDKIALVRILEWFNEFLPVPPVVHNTSSWFKSGAKKHIEKAKEIAMILEKYGIKTEILIKEAIKDIIYEDEWQVVGRKSTDS